LFEKPQSAETVEKSESANCQMFNFIKFEISNLLLCTRNNTITTQQMYSFVNEYSCHMLGAHAVTGSVVLDTVGDIVVLIALIGTATMCCIFRLTF
jgi:hypothetical protein